MSVDLSKILEDDRWQEIAKSGPDQGVRISAAQQMMFEDYVISNPDAREVFDKADEEKQNQLFRDFQSRLTEQFPDKFQVEVTPETAKHRYRTSETDIVRAGMTMGTAGSPRFTVVEETIPAITRPVYDPGTELLLNQVSENPDIIDWGKMTRDQVDFFAKHLPEHSERFKSLYEDATGEEYDLSRLDAVQFGATRGISGMAGAFAGAKAFGKLGLLGGKFAPLTVPLMAAGGGVAGYLTAAKAGEMVYRGFDPSIDETVAEFPMTALAAEIVPGAAVAGPLLIQSGRNATNYFRLAKEGGQMAHALRQTGIASGTMALAGGVTDAGVQAVFMGLGIQDQYAPAQTVAAALISAPFAMSFLRTRNITPEQAVEAIIRTREGVGTNSDLLIVNSIGRSIHSNQSNARDMVRNFGSMEMGMGPAGDEFAVVRARQAQGRASAAEAAAAPDVPPARPVLEGPAGRVGDVPSRRVPRRQTEEVEVPEVVPDMPDATLRLPAPREGTIAPVEYLGYQEGFGTKKGFHMWNLTQDVPGHPKNSTVDEQALIDLGYTVPDVPSTDPKVPVVKQPEPMGIESDTSLSPPRGMPEHEATTPESALGPKHETDRQSLGEDGRLAPDDSTPLPRDEPVDMPSNSREQTVDWTTALGLTRPSFIFNVRRLFQSPQRRLEAVGDPRYDKVASAIRMVFDDRAAMLGKAEQYFRPINNRMFRLSRRDKPRFADEVRALALAQYRGDSAEVARLEQQVMPISKDWVDAAYSFGDWAGNYARGLSVPGRQEKGIHVFDSRIDGWRPMGKIERYWPIQNKPEVDQVINDPKSNPALYEKLIDALIADGRVENRQDGAEYLSSLARDPTVNRDDGFLGNVERARIDPLPEEFLDFSPNAYMRYVDRLARRTAQIKNLGQKRSERDKDVLEKFMTDLTVPQEDRKYIEGIRNMILGLNNPGLGENIIGWANVLATGLQLSPHTLSLRNAITGTMFNAFTMGFRNTARGLKEMASLQKALNGLDDAYMVGAVKKDFFNLLADYESISVQGRPQERITKALQNSTSFLMTIGGYSGTEQLIRVNAFLAGKWYLRSALKEWNKDITSQKSKEYMAAIQRDGFDTDKLIREAMTPDPTDVFSETNKFLRWAVNKPQGAYDLSQTPVFVNTPLGRLFFKYRKFTTQATQNLDTDIIKPLQDNFTKGGERVRYRNPDGEMVDERVRTYGLALKFLGRALAAGYLTGEAFQELRERIFGLPKQGPQADEIKKAFANDEWARASSLVMQRVIINMYLSGFALGMAGELWAQTQDVYERRSTREPFTPPALGIFDGVGTLFAKAIDQGGITLRDIDDFNRQTVGAYRSARQGILNSLNTADVEMRMAQVEAAYNDRLLVRRIAQRFAVESGMGARRRGVFPQMFSERSPIMREVAESLLIGEPARARKLVEDYILELETEEEIERAIASFQSSARWRQPIVVGNNPDDESRALFLEWASQNVQGDTLQLIRRSDRIYRQAAADAGLLTDVLEDELAIRLERRELRSIPISEDEKWKIIERRLSPR